MADDGVKGPVLGEDGPEELDPIEEEEGEIWCAGRSIDSCKLSGCSELLWGLGC